MSKKKKKKTKRGGTISKGKAKRKKEIGKRENSLVQHTLPGRVTLLPEPLTPNPRRPVPVSDPQEISFMYTLLYQFVAPPKFLNVLFAYRKK
jgi:hypothetical protein